MSFLHPCRLSYTIEYEMQVELYVSLLPGSLRFALGRFAADEERFRMGLMAVLESDSLGHLYIGYNATAAAAACLGYATKEDVDRFPSSLPQNKFWSEWGGGGVAASEAEFHWFVPDSPSVFPRDYLMPFTTACDLAVAFVETGQRPGGVRWVLNRGRQSKG